MKIEELTTLIRSKQSSWDDETNQIVNYLWDAWEADSVELETFRARVAKEWPTKGSNLYTEKEVLDIVKKTKDEIIRSYQDDFDNLSPLEQILY